MSGGALASLWIIGSVAIAGALSALVVYGWPALMDWALPRLARWHSRQIRRANVPQEFPPDPVPFPWAALLVTLAVVGLAAFVLFRCGWAR
jgi:hypothetical protein